MNTLWTHLADGIVRTSVVTDDGNKFMRINKDERYQRIYKQLHELLKATSEITTVTATIIIFKSNVIAASSQFELVLVWYNQSPIPEHYAE